MGQWISEGLQHNYLVCNYGMTSCRNRKVYKTGMPGSDCKTGCDATYPALCSAHERYMTELDEMKLEYDLAHGIETLVTASSSINASSRSKRSHSSRRSKSTTSVNRKTCTRDFNTSDLAKVVAVSTINTFAMAESSAKPKTDHHLRSSCSHSHRHSHSHSHAFASAHSS